eukprot:scaffold8327_cov36-Cyclotella_meneghiniana.AAC.1
MLLLMGPSGRIGRLLLSARGAPAGLKVGDGAVPTASIARLACRNSGTALLGQYCVSLSNLFENKLRLYGGRGDRKRRLLVEGKPQIPKLKEDDNLLDLFRQVGGDKTISLQGRQIARDNSVAFVDELLCTAIKVVVVCAFVEVLYLRVVRITGSDEDDIQLMILTVETRPAVCFVEPITGSGFGAVDVRVDRHLVTLSATLSTMD